MTIEVIDFSAIESEPVGFPRRNSIRKEYRNALLAVGVFLVMMGAVGFVGLMGEAISPVAAVADESLGYFSANGGVSVNTPQVALYYLTDGYDASYAVQEAASDLGFAGLAYLFEDTVVTSIDGLFISGTVVTAQLLGDTVAAAFLASLPWWAWVLVGYAAAFGAL